MKRPLASFSGSPAALSLALYCTSVSTVPLGIGLPAFSAAIASGVAEQLAILLVVRTIHGRVEHALVVVFRELDVVAAGLRNECKASRDQRYCRQNPQCFHELLPGGRNTIPHQYAALHNSDHPRNATAMNFP